jgi:hypothetical protein
LLEVDKLAQFFSHWLSIQANNKVMCINYPLTAGLLKLNITASAALYGKLGIRHQDMLASAKAMYANDANRLRYVSWCQETTPWRLLFRL